MFPQTGPVRKQANGTLHSVEPRQGGWMRFHVMEPGRQYPIKLDTSLPQLIQQMMALLGQPVQAEYTESEADTINQRTGKPFVNRRLEAVAPGHAQQQPVQYQPQPQQFQQQPQQAPQQPQAPPVQPSLMGMEKDLNINRQCASKVVGAMLVAGVIPEGERDMPGLVSAAEAWMTYYMYGPLPFSVRPFSQPSQPVVQQQPVAQNGEPDWVSADPGPQEGQYDQYVE